MKNKKILFSLLLGIIFVSTMGATYAFFNLTSSGNENASNISIEDSVLHVIYNGGSEINASGIEPGWTGTKTITIENDGTEGVTYKLYYQNLVNEILGSTSSTETQLSTDSELKISATCSNTITSGTVPSCSGIEKTSVAITQDASGNAISNYNNVIKDKIYIAAGETQTYVITYEFTNTDYSQNYNQNRNFTAKIAVADDNATYDVTFTGLSGVNSVTVSSTTQTIAVSNGSATATGLELGTHTIKIGDTTNTFELRTADTALCTNTGTKTVYASRTQTTQSIALTIDASNNVTAYTISSGDSGNTGGSVPSLPEAKSSLADYTWSEIQALSKNLVAETITTSQLSSTYNINVGDTTASVSITPSGGTAENHIFRLVGLKHDVDASGHTLGMTFEQVDLMNNTYKMKSSQSSSDSWDNSDLKTTINNFTLPTDLDSVITLAKKECVTSVSNSTKTYVTSKLWIMSQTEIAGTQTITYGGTVEGTQYAYYQTNNNASARIKQKNDSNYSYWLRSAYSWDGYNSYFAFVYNGGNFSSYYSYNISNVGVSVCFCI